MFGIFINKTAHIRPDLSVSYMNHGPEKKMPLNDMDKWEIEKEFLEYSGAKNVKIEKDKSGVKRMMYILHGEKVSLERQRLLERAKYSDQQKISYYKKRVNDKALTPKQREYAKQRLAALR